MSTLLTDFQRIESKNGALTQRAVSLEAQVLTKRSRGEGIRDSLADLESSCVQQHDVSACGDVERCEELEKGSRQKAQTELEVSRLREIGMLEVAQLDDAVERAETGLAGAQVGGVCLLKKFLYGIPLGET